MGRMTFDRNQRISHADLTKTNVVLALEGDVLFGPTVENQATGFKHVMSCMGIQLTIPRRGIIQAQSVLATTTDL